MSNDLSKIYYNNITLDNSIYNDTYIIILQITFI